VAKAKSEIHNVDSIIAKEMNIDEENESQLEKHRDPNKL